MRVIVTVPSLDKSFGGPVVKAGLTRLLRERGHAALSVGCANHLEMPGQIGLPTLAQFHGTPVPRTTLPLRRALRSADIVHIIGFRDPVGTTAAFAARRHGIPYILEPSGMLGPKLRSFRLKQAFDSTVGRSVVAGAAVIVATSHLEETELHAAGIAPGRIVRRVNGIHLGGLWPLPERGSLRGRLCIPAGAPVALALGRIMAIKGLPHLVAAAALVPDLHVVIAGPDEGDGTLAMLHADRHRLGIEGRVHVLSKGLWGPEKAQALSDTDLLVMPSQSESFGVAAAEAACVGLPVVISPECGVLDVLDPAFTLVAPYGNAPEWGAAMTKALAMRDDAARHTSAERLRATLDWNAVIEEQIKIYEAVLGGKRSLCAES